MHSSSSSPSRQALLEVRARFMRFNPSASEAALWRCIRGRRVGGVQFRRQVVLGGRFIVDICAPQRRLVVEVDGEYHARRSDADARRDDALRRLGYRVLRLPAELVEREPERAVALIRQALEDG